MPTTIALTIGGTSIDPAAGPLLVGPCVVYAKGGMPTLTLYQRGGALPGLPDPYLGKAVTLALGGTTVFAGDVVSLSPEFDDRLGWVLAYRCLGLRHRGDKVPLTDDNTGLDRAPFNLDPTAGPSYIASRAGRTVGQILSALLTMGTNAANLNNYGLGAYTSLSPPTLPAATVSDLAAMTVIPLAPVYPGGEKLLGAIEAFLDEWAPNHALWIDPATGTLRFLDVRTFAAHSFTLDSDPVEPTPLVRDVGDCFQRVLVRGQPWVEPFLLSLSNGLLAEDFAHDGLSSSAAKAAWTSSNFSQPGGAQDSGTCTTGSTTTVTVTSSDATTAWGADFWDQTASGRHGIVTLYYTAGSGITQCATRRIVANTALTAGGTSTLTLDLALPVTTYDRYTIFGLADGADVVYRLYSCTNAAIGAALQNQFNYPVPYINASNNAAALTSVPTGSVVYGSSAPYNEFPLSFTQDPTSGTFLFSAPTYRVAGNTDPHDVRVLAAVATGANQAVAPADVGGVAQYAGTSHTQEGLADTLVLTLDSWRDPGSLAQVQAYAADVLDSVKDAIIEGAIVYYGLFTPALTMGIGATVTGSTFTTGWESATSFTGGAVPIVECEVQVPQGEGMDFKTILRASSRRQHQGQGAFLRPERTGLELGGDSGPFNDLAAHGVGLGAGAATSAAGLAAGLADRAVAPDLSGVATDPASYLADQGAPTSMADMGLPTTPASYLADQGAPTSMADMGLPTTPGDLGIPAGPDEFFGGDS